MHNSELPVSVTVCLRNGKIHTSFYFMYVVLQILSRALARFESTNNSRIAPITAWKAAVDKQQFLALNFMRSNRIDRI